MLEENFKAIHKIRWKRANKKKLVRSGAHTQLKNGKDLCAE